MRVWQVLVSVRLALMVVLSGSLVGVLALRVEASTPPQPSPYQGEGANSDLPTLQGGIEGGNAGLQPTTAMPQISELEQPATSVNEWIAQIEASLVQITGVRVEKTEAGLQVILETEGALEVPETRVVGNALIVDIANATIAEEFSQPDPIKGIALVSVTELPGDRVRVAITGTDVPPAVEVTSEAQGLVLAVTLGDADAVAEEDEIQVVVTGEQDEGYNPSSASTATRTDTPLRDIPQSIQVVPRQVLEDRRPRNLIEATETVSGVVPSFGFSSLGGSTIIRGFNVGDSGGAASLRNGFRDVDAYGLVSPETIEQVEVLKGPGSVLFGALEPGGIINVITRQPLSEPYYNLTFEAGNYGVYQPSIDLSGPLTEDNTVLYRFIASYRWADSFQDFVNSEQATIAPSITVNFGERTSLNLYYEYNRVLEDPYFHSSILLSDGSLTPRDLFISYPDVPVFDIVTQRYGYILNHEFNDSWQIRNNFSVAATRTRQVDLYTSNVVDDRFVEFQYYDGDYSKDNYSAQIDLLGKFNTGSILHQLLVGFDFNRFVDQSGRGFFTADFPRLDIRNPNYDNITRPDLEVITEGRRRTIQSYGIYLQDQIAFSDNLKLLIGGRYDWVSDKNTPFEDGVDGTVNNDGAFSPRVGLVYQPNDTVSLYASYSSSFRPSGGSNPDGRRFEPTRGTQYEIGVKTDFLDGGLSANLAAYHLTKTNVTTPDPDRPRFSIQTGEQRSQGIELDITGEILPGWNITASYAYTDAEVTADNVIPVGNQLAGAPQNQASLWTTYEIQTGSLEGLGFGLGLFYVGERQVDLDNSLQLEDHLRTDAALYYRRDGFRYALNVRNLFNIDYISYGFGRTSLYRGDPFTITGSISWEF